MRIIFVGIHNKPNMKPLDILTKTGKLINRIIKELNTDIEIVKTNLFDVDFIPDDFYPRELSNVWYWTHLPTDEDVIVLLGAMTHNNFNFEGLQVIKVAHPASKRSHVQMDQYVRETSEKIHSLIHP